MNGWCRPAVFVFAVLFSQSGALGQVSNLEYLIYSDLLQQLEFERPKLKDFVVDTFIIEGRTGVDLSHRKDDASLISEYIMGHFRELDPSVFTSFETRNQERAPIDKDRFGDISVELISERQVDEYFQPDPGKGWSRFYEDHPLAQGILLLSRVGVSADGRQALVYAGDQWDFLAGTGDFYMLERSQSGWTIKKRLNIWVS